MNRPEEIWGDWSGVEEDRDLDPIIDPNAWGHVEDMTDESLADHLDQRAEMLDERRPGPKMLREAAERLRTDPDPDEEKDSDHG